MNEEFHFSKTPFKTVKGNHRVHKDICHVYVIKDLHLEYIYF